MKRFPFISDDLPNCAAESAGTREALRGEPAEVWRDAAVRAAGIKHAKPFKCGPDDMAREVMRTPGNYVVTLPGNVQTDARRQG